MRQEFIPYYLSRVILSFGFSIFVMGFTWAAMLWGFILTGVFVLAIHSGWYKIDLKIPMFPLRRDEHALKIQRKSLIAAVLVAVNLYLISGSLGLPAFTGETVFGAGVLIYFITQFVFFVRAQV